MTLVAIKGYTVGAAHRSVCGRLPAHHLNTLWIQYRHVKAERAMKTSCEYASVVSHYWTSHRAGENDVCGRAGFALLCQWVLHASYS